MKITDKPAPVTEQGDTQGELKDYISGRPFLRGLSEAHQRILSDCAMLQKFAPGEVIFQEGDPANRFYLVVDGEVALETSGATAPILIQKIGAGDVLGWSWLFPPYYWHFSARATKPTKAIFFYGTRLRDICDEDASFGYELIKRITGVVIHRLQSARRELSEISKRSV